MSYIAYGIFSDSNNTTPRVGARFNNAIIDISKLPKLGILDINLDQIFNAQILNPFMEYPQHLREKIKPALETFLSNMQNSTYKNQQIIYNNNEITMHMPIKVMGYTDFYTSEAHATHIGRIFRPDDQPLLPNWKHIPIAYNGRASSIVISGYPIKRPKGQIFNPSINAPELIPCQKLDFEVELGVIIGKKNELGTSININDASSYIFGVCILNDWSARDIQSWEYQPLGPFNSKGFATSISPWIIPIEELDKFKVPIISQDPKPLDYLLCDDDYLYDIHFEAILKPKNSKDQVIISKTNFKFMYWTISQWIAHHTISGTSLNPGDILGSGTISGFEKGTLGCLMEITKNGQNPITLPNGELRSFLQDGDELIIKAYCGADRELDFGSVTGVIVPS